VEFRRPQHVILQDSDDSGVDSGSLQQHRYDGKRLQYATTTTTTTSTIVILIITMVKFIYFYFFIDLKPSN